MLIDKIQRTDAIVARLSALIESGLSLDQAVAELQAQRCGQLYLRTALVRGFGLSGREAARVIARHAFVHPSRRTGESS